MDRGRDYDRYSSRRKDRRRRSTSSSSSSRSSHSSSDSNSRRSKHSKSRSHKSSHSRSSYHRRSNSRSYKRRDRSRDRYDKYSSRRRRRSRTRSSSSSSRSKSRSLSPKDKLGSSSSSRSMGFHKISPASNLQSKIEEKLNFGSQLERQMAIEDIESEGFRQKGFKSGVNVKTTENIILGQIQLPSIELKPANLTNLDKEILYHPNLIVNQREKDEEWVKHLYDLRQKLYADGEI